MGHKVHPTGIRLGIAKDWNSKWYANKGEYAVYLAADLKVREMLRKKLAAAGISKIQIERPAKTARVTIHTARPGVVIGKKGEDIEKLRKEVTDMMGVPTHINVSEVRKPELDATLTGTHSDFDGLAGDRLVREHADPELAATLDEARDATTGRFDLTCGQLTVRRRLEAVLAEAHEVGIECKAVITTLMHLAVLGTLRLQHGNAPYLAVRSRRFSPPSRRDC
jgi:hypothetical protein